MVAENGVVYFTVTEVFVLLLCVMGIVVIIMLAVLIVKMFRLVRHAKKVVEKIDGISNEIQDAISEVKPTVEKCNQSLLNINSWVGNVGGIAVSVFEWVKGKLS